jgi:RNA polymerase sigma-70 factor (ECF subfamily)
VNDSHLEYLQLVTRHQAAIYGYLRSIAPGAPLEDILQEVNIVLWNRAADFEPGTNFKAFAFRIAHFKALEALRAAKRREWLVFDSDLLESIAERQEESRDDDPQAALRECLGRLADDDRSLLHRRYTARQTVREIARGDGRSEGALQQVFFRLRSQLRACIERRLAMEGGVP